ncbi:MAG: hypothetical protein LBF97_01720, partial [Elusimicrobiota bacterium]|nr:hypothetical protein [Elusimicrobiota bacterium]
MEIGAQKLFDNLDQMFTRIYSIGLHTERSFQDRTGKILNKDYNEILAGHTFDKIVAKCEANFLRRKRYQDKD